MIKESFYYLIFCDSSLDPKSKKGVGGTLALPSNEMSSQILTSDLMVKTKVFTDTTNTRLELETVLWGLGIFKKGYQSKRMNKTYYPNLIVFTDCRAVSDLPARRAKLEAVGFKSKRTGKALSNADLYRKFYSLYDELEPKIEWIKGHSPRKHHDVIQSVFSHVDKTTRAKLREYRNDL